MNEVFVSLPTPVVDSTPVVRRAFLLSFSIDHILSLGPNHIGSGSCSSFCSLAMTANAISSVLIELYSCFSESRRRYYRAISIAVGRTTRPAEVKRDFKKVHHSFPFRFQCSCAIFPFGSDQLST